jgi:RNA polymerase sigma-70 factor (ECF subfamily)
VSDAELVRELHDQHAEALWRYVLTLTGGDDALAHDVVQETLLRAWRNPHVLNADTGSPRAWLYTVARRIVIDEWRTTRHRHETVTDRLPEQPVSDAADQIANREIVAAAMQRLSQDHREVLRECYLRGSSVAQAAEALGIAQGTVKSRTHYALRSLRLAIDELGGVP